MIWKHWGMRELQQQLEIIDSGLLERLKAIIPPLAGDDFDPTELDKKKNLVKILMSFAPSKYFSKRDNMEACLMRLPPATLSDFCNFLRRERSIFIPGTDFEDRVSEIQRIRWSDREFSSAFLEFFELPAHFMPPEKSTTANHVDIEPISEGNPPISPSPFKQLKDFQNQVYTDAIKTMQAPRCRFVIQMPTGSGKTRTSMEIICRFLRDQPEGTVVVWLAHSRELCEQAFQSFIEVWQYLSNKSLKAIRCWGNHPLPAAYGKSMFIVGGFQKIHSALRKEEGRGAFEAIKDRIGLIVVDEAHKAVAPTYKDAIQDLSSSNTKIIGLTATPGRADEEETEEMSEFFFESKVDISPPGGESEIEFLKRERVLSKIEYIPIRTNLNIKLTDSQRRKMEEEFDFPVGILNKVGNDDVRNLEIMRRLIFSARNGRRILFFSCSVKHSRFILSLLLYFGVKAEHVDGTTSNARREQAISDFKTGGIQVLCNFGVLTTGFDAPNTDEVFISRPTNSVVLYSQMIGRGLRGPAIGGTPSCRIVDVRDNISGFGDQERVYHWFEGYWDN